MAYNKLNIAFSLLFFATNAKRHISFNSAYAFSNATNKCSNSGRVTMDYIPLVVARKKKKNYSYNFLKSAGNVQ